MNLTSNQGLDDIGLISLPVIPMIIIVTCLVLAAIYLFIYDDYD